MEPITILPYTPAWAADFEAMKSWFMGSLDGLAADIQHVGSTSVPGLAAKPILDIDIIIEDRAGLPAVIAALGILGYDHLGDMGITDRAAFRLRTDDSAARRWPAHHLYVCSRQSTSLRNHLALRDALRAAPDLAAAYAQLKLDLAARFPHDMDRYVTGKTAFILRVLSDAGFGSDALLGIARENGSAP